MKKVAIIGAGFAGLAAAWHLSEKFHVSLFDRKGIGSGASGASTGLLHPYPGEHGRRSWKADEGMQATIQLLDIAEQEMGRPVALRNGIIKIGKCIGAQEDVDPLGDNRFLIRSGITVFVPLYLEGLWRACQKRDVQFVLEEIKDLKTLDEFDHVIIAAGSGIRHFKEAESLKINFVKGQALLCACLDSLERSETSSHYTALTENPERCYVGATYEKDFISEHPSLEIALHLLVPQLPVLGVRSGVRVTNPAHYFPIVQKLNHRTWVMTALGSRGLLYHAYLAQQLNLE